MSGYLSRIVQTAGRSSQQLRPLTGSIFGAPAERMQAHSSQLSDAPFVIDSEVPAPLPGASDAQTAAAANPSSRILQSSLEGYRPLQPSPQPHAHTPLQTQHGAASFESSQDHQHSAQKPSPSTPRADSTAPQAVEKQTFTARIAPRSDPPREEPTLRSAESDVLTADSLHPPSYAVKSQESAQSNTSNQTSMVASSPRILAPPPVRAQQLPLRDQRAQSAHEPSIEIHIGRIEVLAMQPPAPSAPTPRRERTTSLADYLAGQNGRRS